MDPGSFLIDPSVCETERPPRLTIKTTPEFRDVITAALHNNATPGPLDPKLVADLAKSAATDPCAAAWARLLAAR